MLGAVLEEVWSGDALLDLDTHPQDSLHNRIYAVIHYLAAKPKVAGKGWDQFLDADSKIAWEKVAVAGHSFGTGYTALIAKKHALDRALFFAGPLDVCTSSACVSEADDITKHDIVPANWMKGDHATDAWNYFALMHTSDTEGKIERQARARLNWELLGIEGSEGIIDGLSETEIEALGTHRLLSSQRVWDGPTDSMEDQQDEAHNDVAQDRDPYEVVWRFMLTATKPPPEKSTMKPTPY